MNIIEFNGIPGSGKSTLVDNLYNKMILQNMKVIKSNDIFLEYRASKLQKKIAINIAMFFKSFKVTCLAFKFSLNYGLNRHNIKRVRLLLLLIYLMKREKENKDIDYFLYDEGIIQFISSIAYDKRIIESKSLILLLNAINSQLSNLYFVNCIVPLNISIDRIKNREAISPRYNIEGVSNIDYLLKCKMYNLDKIRNIMSENKKDVEVDMENSIDENTDYILNCILSGWN